MPQTNNISVSSSASIVYFLLTFVTLLVLAIQYEIVNFSLRSTLIWWRVFSGLYGLAILVLGCVELGIEISGMQNTC